MAIIFNAHPFCSLVRASAHNICADAHCARMQGIAENARNCSGESPGRVTKQGAAAQLHNGETLFHHGNNTYFVNLLPRGALAHQLGMPRY